MTLMITATILFSLTIMCSFALIVSTKHGLFITMNEKTFVASSNKNRTSIQDNTVNIKYDLQDVFVNFGRIVSMKISVVSAYSNLYARLSGKPGSDNYGLVKIKENTPNSVKNRNLNTR